MKTNDLLKNVYYAKPVAILSLKGSREGAMDLVKIVGRIKYNKRIHLL